MSVTRLGVQTLSVTTRVSVPVGLTQRAISAQRVVVDTGASPTRPVKVGGKLVVFFFVFLFFFYRSSLALHRRSSTEILPDYWATFLWRGPPMSVFFVSGSSRIRTHVLVIRRRTP